jgi:prepilin-type N-terminal cleavage/methylation domain-containing protein
VRHDLAPTALVKKFSRSVLSAPMIQTNLRTSKAGHLSGREEPPMSNKRNHQHSDEGFTLVEILIAIVVVGILAAVVVVGISSLTSKGNTTACTTSRDAAIAGATVYYTNNATYPTTMLQMTGHTPPELTLPTGVAIKDAGTDKVVGNGTWTLTISGGGTTAPVFTCA